MTGKNAVDARQWFASDRRSLLAPFGTGTLDQALLSVLPAKHCGLRLFALAGKVVVCDEVHSYDPYTSRLLDALIKDLLLLRCTVIVLTATLPAARKAQLLVAAGATTVPAGTGLSVDYGGPHREHRGRGECARAGSSGRADNLAGASAEGRPRHLGARLRGR